MLPDPFFSIDAVAAGLLSLSDVDNFLQIAREGSRAARLTGGVSTSLEPAGTHIEYRLLDGNDVVARAPRLHALYSHEFRRLAERVFGRELISSPDVVNGVNINLLEGAGGRYEWHYDSNPYTGLLVLSPSSAALGGRLLFGRDRETQVALSMFPGQLLLFDARNAAHAVEELREATDRATVPMNFFVAGEVIERPTDLDGSLYGS
ncbi:MAG: hypothetical protein ABI435_02515 [Pseudolysinimonas sp.]